MDSSRMQARIEDLESRLAFQDQDLDELGQRMLAQQHQLEKLQQLVDSLMQRLSEEADNRSGPSPADEKPPHY